MTNITTTPTIKTNNGPVQGLEQNGIHAFVGLPYAAPPTGANRWRPPRPPQPWQEVRLCEYPSPSAPQPDFMGTPGPMDEDCLALNIWAPADAAGKRLPVMVWLHGGGFVIGSGSILFYDGSKLALNGVVVVSINYRLGPLGWLAHPELSAESDDDSSGNYGLMDQIAALEWVRDNIAEFGGDPGNVTLFGQSAGAISICRLMCSPPAKGLFHKVICQSGGPTAFLRFLRQDCGWRSAAETMGKKLQKVVGGRLEGLRRIPAMDLIKLAIEKMPLANGEFGGMIWGPVIGGNHQPEDPFEVIRRGEQCQVPVLAGSTADDMTAFVRWLPVNTVSKFHKAIGRQAGDLAPALMKLFPCNSDDELYASLTAITTVQTFAAPVRLLANAASANGSWLYNFSHVPSPKYVGAMYQCSEEQAVAMGASHSLDIPFVFGTLGFFPGIKQEDRDLSEMMTSYWVNFARSGDPNGYGLPLWPSHDPQTDQHLELKPQPVAGQHYRKEACDIAEELWFRDRCSVG